MDFLQVLALALLPAAEISRAARDGRTHPDLAADPEPRAARGDRIVAAVVGAELMPEAPEGAAPWLVYAAVFIDLFSDGLMIGVGSVVFFNLALVLAVG